MLDTTPIIDFSLVANDTDKYALTKVDSDVLVVGAWSVATAPTPNTTDKKISNKKSPAVYIADAISALPALKAVLNRGDIATRLGASTLLFDVEGLSCPRLLIVGLGEQNAAPIDDDDKTLLDIYDTIHRTLWSVIKPLKGVKTVHLSLPYGICADNLSTDYHSLALNSAVLRFQRSFYHFSSTKNTAKKADKPTITHCTIALPAAALANGNKTLQSAQALQRGLDLTQSLANLAPNLCTPTFLAKTAEDLATRYSSVKVEVLGEKQIAALKMNAFLAVAKGSEQPPRFIVMHYNGGPTEQAPIVLVGKGITFDAGGISIKPASGMDEMKYDMCGAATVIGAIEAAAAAQLPLNIVAVVPSCENLPSGRATKPGDIVTSMNGHTIEILNTDAEGRLILCDALTFCERLNPRYVIDIATLTGACKIALGSVHSGLFTRHDAAHDNLANALIQAGVNSGDTVWRMPLDNKYQKMLDSNFADIANIGNGGAGSVTAAFFLARFTKKYTWAHLDIAATAWHSGKEKGASGRPLPLIMAFLQQQATINS